MTRQRVVASRAVLQEVLRSGQVPSELRLPGQEAFEQLCRRFLLEAWALGFVHGEREVARLRARQRAVRFAEVDLAGLPTQARQDVERRLGRLLDWGRGWDSAVHQVADWVKRTVARAQDRYEEKDQQDLLALRQATA